ncbi:transporter substrate-binding domain-containing protein [Pseudomonas sp. GX19020]|uniref:transporter substrate-binding domain-containing protein n=1 Tax=Pseudomonas sp. GX19020 TaxID=2942277 RepID=UPI0020190F44|nr:transporter substrate-binding domain-containing protein [Pseudomonas sp. GX19020]MCL4068159.1 transporter substrate-binding domain-containing protein [Pseudomonas sp. GX19020]
MKILPLGRRVAVAASILAIGVGHAMAGQLEDRIGAGDPIRIGFANETPFAYPGEGNSPEGFVNAHTLGVLKAMGYENIEVVVMDWGGLIPALNAGRIDIVTGGLNITGSRCANVAFAEPMLQAGDAFLVPTGNPKGINTYADLVALEGVFVTGSGYNTVEIARKEGVPDANIMQVPGNSEIVAALTAGRADAGGVTHFSAIALTEGRDDLEVSDVSQMPDWTINWAAVAFRKDDSDFVEKFNEAQAEFLGSDAMLQAVAPYGYTEANLPGEQTAAWVCENR